MKSAFIAVVALGLAVPLFAQEAGTEPILPPPGDTVAGDVQQVAAAVPKPKEVVAKFLDLTADQVTQWDALLQKQAETLKPLAEQAKSNGEALRAALGQPAPDPLAVGTLVVKGKLLGEQMAAAHKDYVQGLEALLTTEQKGRLGAIRMAERLQPLLPAFRLLGLLPRT